MKIWEIEIDGHHVGGQPRYLYVETDDDIEIDIGSTGEVTHICEIDNMGELADLVIRRIEDGN